MNDAEKLLRRPYPSALLTPDGVIRRLNAPMATALGEADKQCVGTDFAGLLSEDQRILAQRLLAQGATGKRSAMAVLQFPGPGDASLASLVEARLIDDPAGGEPLLWVHSLRTRNDLSSLLIPFRIAAKAGGLGLLMYSVSERALEWAGGAPEVGSLFPDTPVTLPWVMERVHPEDRKALRDLLRLTSSAQSSWVDMRFRTHDGNWHNLVCQARRVSLGYGGPTVTFGLIRDETRQKTQREQIQAELKAEQEYTELIAEFSSALIAATTEQGLQQVLMTRLATTFGSHGALLGIVEAGRLRVSSDAGVSPDEADAVHALTMSDESLLPDAIRKGKPTLVRSGEEYARRWPRGASVSWFNLPGTDRSAVFTPLSGENEERLGGWVLTYENARRPSSSEQTLMSTMGHLTGQALRRVRAQQARIELVIALQKSLLPTLPEDTPGLELAARYRPSRGGLEIGGDWYDAFALPDGGFALEIGDVQGHDVEAAAVMGSVRVAMRAIAGHEAAPGTVLARINELLIATSATRFATCAMLHIDPRTGRVTGASAGHPPMVHARNDGTHTVRTLPVGPALGVVPTAYTEDSFMLDHDGALIMVTDGVVEGPGLELEDGLRRAGELASAALREGLDAEAVADRVLEAAEAVDHSDDVAVLVIRRR